MRVPPPGQEEQDQHVENEVSNERKVQSLDSWGHDELSLSPRFFHEQFDGSMEIVYMWGTELHHPQPVSVAQGSWGIFPKNF